MNWNPNQAPDPNQPGQYGAYTPPPSQPNDPYSGQYGQQQSGYGQQGGYQQQGGYYEQPPNQPPDANQQQGGYQQYGQPGQQPPYGQGGYQPGQQPPYGQQQQQYGAKQQFNAQQMLGSMVGGPNPQAQAPTSMGLPANIAAALSYLFGWVSGLIIFFVEKKNRYVRFSAAQSIILFAAITVLFIIFGFIPFIGPILTLLLQLVTSVSVIALVVLSFLGREVRIPFVSDYAEKLLNRFPNP